MNTKETFRERLSKLREEKGLSRQVVANELGVSRTSLEYYEKGQRVPDIVVLSALAEYFNVSADYLLGLSDVKSIDPTKKLNIAREFTNLSEECVITLNSASFNEDSRILNKLVSEFVYNLIQYNFVIKTSAGKMDILLPNDTSDFRISTEEYDKLYRYALKCGYTIFSTSEVFEYHNTQLQNLVSSAAKKSFEKVFKECCEISEETK